MLIFFHVKLMNPLLYKTANKIGHHIEDKRLIPGTHMWEL